MPEKPKKAVKVEKCKTCKWFTVSAFPMGECEAEPQTTPKHGDGRCRHWEGA